MASNYPSTLDNSTSLPYPSASSDTNSPSLAAGQSNQNDAVIAVETLVGTNASQTTPTAQYNVLQATSASASEWAKLTANNMSSTTGSGAFVLGTSPTISTPSISGGTIDNSTVTVDSVAGHTTSNSGTIYGISIASAKLSGAAISSGTITATSLGTDSSWSWAAFTPSPTGYTGIVTVTLARYKKIGKTVYLEIIFTGTSNATTCTFTLPVAPLSSVSFHTTVTDSGTVQTSSGLLSLTASSTTATCYKTLASGAFTNSGTKAVTVCNVIYETA